MSKRIILISCVSKKSNHVAKAKDLYKSPLFISSLAYAYRQKPDKIFILSALYGLLDLDKRIAPYDVTLSNIPKNKRYSGLIVLTPAEKVKWGAEVVRQLSIESDLNRDTFIILAGAEYINPIIDSIKKIEIPLKGKRYGERVKFLNEN